MPKGNDSEEKTLPATKKKLDEARKKGQVARSKDMTGGAGMVGALLFLLLGGGGALAAITAMLDQAGDLAQRDFTEALGPLLMSVRTAAIQTVVPMFGLVLGLTVLSAVAVMKGIPFAIDPITPKMDNINPAEGFQRLFSMKALVELLKSMLKVLLLGAVLVALLWAGLRGLILAPGCGLGCVQGAFRAVAVPLLGAAAALFLVAGMVDVGLQGWLFKRDQKMSITEQKRERKEQDGDPMVRGQRKRQIREAAQAPVARVGLRQATIMVHDGAGTVVGLRFVRGETPVPLMACRARGERGPAMLAEASGLGLPIEQDAELVGVLTKGVQPGGYIPPATYQAAAQVLSRAGLV